MEGKIPKPEAKKKSENDLETVENLSVPERVKKLITEKYKFKSLADFERLNQEERKEIFTESFLSDEVNKEDKKDDLAKDIKNWQKLCFVLGLKEKEIFPESSFDDYGIEYMNIFSPYEDKYREYYRKQLLGNRADAESGEHWNFLQRQLIKDPDFKEYSDWFGLSFEKKRQLMEDSGFKIKYDDDMSHGHIRSGYALIEPSKYKNISLVNLIKAGVKDRWFNDRDKKTLLRAEEAIYDKEYLIQTLVVSSVEQMDITLPKNDEQRKLFDEINSPDMNAAKARSWTKGMKDEDLRNQIIEAYEKHDQEKGQQ